MVYKYFVMLNAESRNTKSYQMTVHTLTLYYTPRPRNVPTVHDPRCVIHHPQPTGLSTVQQSVYLACYAFRIPPIPKWTAVRRPFLMRSSVEYGGSSMEKKHVWLTWITCNGQGRLRDRVAKDEAGSRTNHSSADTPSRVSTFARATTSFARIM